MLDNQKFLFPYFSSSVDSCKILYSCTFMILLNRECYLQMLAGILMGRQPSIPSLYTWVLDLSDHIAFLALSHVLTVPSGLQGQCHSNSAVEQTLGICFTDSSSSRHSIQCHSRFRTGKVRHRIWDSLSPLRGLSSQCWAHSGPPFIALPHFLLGPH